MTYKSVTEGKPKPLTRVWVMTDTGRETTGYVKSDGEWFINCPRIGRLARRCCAGRRTVSSVANWSYTATATIWRSLGKDELAIRWAMPNLSKYSVITRAG